MQDDPFPAAERILADIESIFQKDPELKEFDILPVTLNQNKSPIHHVENCLGLELWCVRHVYCYAYKHLFEMRQQKSRRTDPEVQSRLLMGALLLNPDVQTFWNMRRELLQACRLECQAELHFTSVVLSRKPKCAEAFSYRKWIVTKLKRNGEKVENLLYEELKVARNAANRYANNYHAWQHSIWCLVQLTPAEIGFSEVYLDEWNATRAWTTMHISDYSGWQYRQYLVQQLCGPLIDKIPNFGTDVLFSFLGPFLHNSLLEKKELQGSDDSKTGERTVSNSVEEDFFSVVNKCSKTYLMCSLSIILSELELSTDLITRYIGHEALWCHRRFILSFLKSLLDKSFECANSHCVNAEGCCEGSSRFLCLKNICLSRNSFYDKELNSCCSDRTGNIDSLKCDGILESVKDFLYLLNQAFLWHESQLLELCVGTDSNQEKFSSQHRKWLQDILGLTVSS